MAMKWEKIAVMGCERDDDDLDLYEAYDDVGRKYNVLCQRDGTYKAVVFVADKEYQVGVFKRDRHTLNQVKDLCIRKGARIDINEVYREWVKEFAKYGGENKESKHPFQVLADAVLKLRHGAEIRCHITSCEYSRSNTWGQGYCGHGNAITIVGWDDAPTCTSYSPRKGERWQEDPVLKMMAILRQSGRRKPYVKPNAEVTQPIKRHFDAPNVTVTFQDVEP